MTGLVVFECARCATTLFPARYLCPSCGGAQWHERIAAHGTVIAATIVRHRVAAEHSGSVHVASVATDAGPIVIARIDADVQVGDAVSVDIDARQQIAAHRREQQGD